MIVRRAPLLLMVGLVALIGCRDALVDESLQAEAPPSGPTPTANTMYVKGPDAIRVGEVGDYRAEPVHEAVRYAWSQESLDQGRVSGMASDPTFRLFALTGVRAGTVNITVEAFDADNQMIRVATRRIIVQ